ncbi:MAG: hypothetical protein ACTSPA_09630 [Promethearchaeota archaeon]
MKLTRKEKLKEFIEKYKLPITGEWLENATSKSVLNQSIQNFFIGV